MKIKKEKLVSTITITAAICTIIGTATSIFLHSRQDPIDPVIAEAASALKYAEKLEKTIESSNTETSTDLEKTRQTKEYFVQSIVDIKEKLQLIKKEGSRRKLKKMNDGKMVLTLMQLVQKKQEIDQEISAAMTKMQEDIEENERIIKSLISPKELSEFYADLLEWTKLLVASNSEQKEAILNLTIISVKVNSSGKLDDEDRENLLKLAEMSSDFYSEYIKIAKEYIKMLTEREKYLIKFPNASKPLTNKKSVTTTDIEDSL